MRDIGIDVSQVMESDKKLKVVNYLKHNSSIKLKNIKSLEISLDEEDFMNNNDKKHALILTSQNTKIYAILLNIKLIWKKIKMPTLFILQVM